jgi:hypothetical protein
MIRQYAMHGKLDENDRIVNRREQIRDQHSVFAW